MKILSFKQNYIKIITSFPLNVNLFKRGYPGHARTILNLINKAIPKTSNTALIPMRETNINNATKNKLIRNFLLDKSYNNPSIFKGKAYVDVTGAVMPHYDFPKELVEQSILLLKHIPPQEIYFSYMKNIKEDICKLLNLLVIYYYCKFIFLKYRRFFSNVRKYI